MNRVLIGSSNVYRFYKSDTYKDYNTYSMVKCTDIKSFAAIMTNLEAGDTEIIISVLENFLENAGRNQTTEEGYSMHLGEVFSEFNKIVKTAAKRKPNAKFCVVEPIKRPSQIWYQNMYEDILKTCDESISSMRIENLTKIEGIPEGCQQFEQDGTHLTEAAGQIFIEGILTKAETFFKAPVIDLVNNDRTTDDDDEHDDLETRVKRLEGHVRARQQNDNLVFARLKEESDSAANKLKEDRVIITGITSKTVPPTEPEERKVWIKTIAMDIFKMLIPDFPGEIHFVNQAKNNGLHIPMIEVKLNSVESAANIRKAFTEKRKAKADLGRIFIANSVGLSTRIRVDILKALARKVSNNSVMAHVVAFVLRPVMHVRPKEGSVDRSPPKTLTFVDAVATYGHLLKQVELGDAYRRAGNSFKGQLEQLFVVMRESDGGAGRARHQHPAGGIAGSGRPDSRKRPRETDEDDYGGFNESRYEPSTSRGGRARGRGRGKKWHRGS